MASDQTQGKCYKVKWQNSLVALLWDTRGFRGDTKILAWAANWKSAVFIYDDDRVRGETNSSGLDRAGDASAPISRRQSPLGKGTLILFPQSYRLILTSCFFFFLPLQLR